MADGTFAVLMFALGLTDMHWNHCGTEAGCLGRSEAPRRISVAAGEWLERRATPQPELYIRYDLDHKLGPFGNAVGFSVAENGEMWVGYGQTYEFQIADSPFYGELHALTGLYAKNGGFDLGVPIEFRSGVELGYENDAGWRFAVGYDHRSNTGIFGGINPGVEMAFFKLSVPLR